MKHKIFYIICTVIGICIGLFGAFFYTISVFEHKFDEPWDLFWNALNSITGTILGSLLGGLIAYFVAIRQMNIQNELSKKSEIDSQTMLSTRIQNELKNNKKPVQNISALLDHVKGNFDGLSRAISRDDDEVREGLMVYINQIETSLLLQLRTDLVNLDYIELHKIVDTLDQIKKTGELLQSQKTPEYIHLSLKRLLKLSTEFSSSINSL